MTMTAIAQPAKFLLSLFVFDVVDVIGFVALVVGEEEEVGVAVVLIDDSII
jgi:hypothetical protein